MADKDERSTSSKTQSGDRSIPDKKKAATTKPAPKQAISNEKVKDLVEDTNTKLIRSIESLQKSISAQTVRMAEHDRHFEEQGQKLRALADRLDYYDNFDPDYEEEELCDDVVSLPSHDGPAGSQHHKPDTQTGKRKSENRFESMNKKFKAADICDVDVDGVLATNINELFRSGMDETRYNELVKDENNARPSNCDGLVVVHTNPLIWDAVSATARSADKKMQNIEAAVVKSATILVKTVDKMACMEKFLKEQCQDSDNTICQDFGAMLDDCNNALALLGHGNKLINLARKDFLRPQINKEYSHLCNHSRPYTHLLFGDDVSKDAREIEDCSKISSKIFTNRPSRGAFNFRRMGRGPRFSRGRGRFFTNEPQAGTSGQQTKNYPRRGSRPFYRQ